MPFCTVCQTKLAANSRDTVTISCGHTFCTGCIRTSLDYSNKCPVCRQPLLYMFNIRRTLFLCSKSNITGVSWLLGIDKCGKTCCALPSHKISICNK